VRDDGAVVGHGVRYKPVISILQKGVDRCGLVSMAARPIAHGTKRWQHRVIGSQKEFVSSCCGPLRQLVVSGLQFVPDLLDARDLARAVLLYQPIPESGAEVEAIVQVLGLDEDVRIDEIISHPITPASRPRLLKVSVFWTPTIRNASR